MRLCLAISALAPKRRTVITIENNKTALLFYRTSQRFHMLPDAIVHRQGNSAEMNRVNSPGNIVVNIHTLGCCIKAAVQAITIGNPAGPDAETILQKI
ncbi:hypothetical protein D3C77_666270 [compost metagenome]